jgi:3-phenylpropionate/cinnamic acid dioxygenase small subunit
LTEEVNSFYARQYRLLDENRLEEWSETYTEDIVYSAANYKSVTKPRRGRAHLVESAKTLRAECESRNVLEKHWLGMSEIEEQDDGTIRVVSNILVLETSSDGPPALRTSSTAVDKLVRVNGTLQISERLTTRDGGPAK